MRPWYIKKDGKYLTTSIEVIEEYQDYSDISEMHLTIRRFDSNKDIAKQFGTQSDAQYYICKNRLRYVDVVRE
ncbi:hypothetical protein GCM10023206_06570 [Acinetobacter puyangensis]|uniref:Uncharacterized protein n=1 Tax=Acinetobacter puyangensis TaxID=1096779 RepID=A0A240E8M8_9GAMM|nr:hypothetical protein SAMN05421731_102426 [Acinetobacter puyangensis]